MASQRTRRRAALGAVLAVGALVSSACVERVEIVQGGSGPGATAPANVQGGQNANGAPAISGYEGQQLSFGTVPSTPQKAGGGEPIKIGMINQENSPIGSFPEIRLGAQAAVDFINAELGGVRGRPLELVPCVTTFSVEKSQKCAQDLVQQDVIAVTGGIDITSTGSMPVLEQNQMPYIGGVPVNFAEMQSPISFQFSGGAPGAFVAFAKHAADHGAKKVAVAYADYAPIKAAAVDFGVKTLKDLGVPEVVEIPFPVTATDLLPVMSKAKEAGADAVFVGAADTACAPAMKTAHDLGLTAQLYLVGSCAAPNIGDQIGKDAVEGRIFNIENPANLDDPESKLYFTAVAKHGSPDLPAASAATISFRDVMNIYALLEGLPDGQLDKDHLREAVSQARNRPSFAGHPYTCDGKQVPNMPALCAPQQILVQRHGDDLVPVSDWIDVPALVGGGSQGG